MEITKQNYGKSESIASIAMAMAKSQAAMGKLLKNASNPFFKNNYADLAAVIDACKESLNSHDIAIIQCPCGDGNLVGVTTLLTHKSGEWLESTLMLSPVKKDPQGAGSCITYARRYALAAMVGLAQEDDDAEQAVSRNKALPQPKPKSLPKSLPKIDRDDALRLAKSCTSLGELIEVHKQLSPNLQEELKEEFGEIKNNLAR